MRAGLCLILVSVAPLAREGMAQDGPALTLQQAVQLALETSPSLEALRARWDGAEADLVRAATYPHIPPSSSGWGIGTAPRD